MVLFVYVDNSNVWIEGQYIEAVRLGLAAGPPDAARRRVTPRWSYDFGRLYELACPAEEQIGDQQEWHGHVLAAQDPARKPAWLELAPTIAGASGRVALPAPAQVPVGTSDPPWPTPAECYLATLAPVTNISIATSGHVAEAGPEETAEIVATVADSLMAVGALPVTRTATAFFERDVLAYPDDVCYGG